ncbi:galacturonokinase-like isoform X1 [Primulina tabacum]|uniref:galacturonokinase-like isoform X1 n=1 Tax=Primulina tabacum TaxID=48773 RepID=UPI003F5962D3
MGEMSWPSESELNFIKTKVAEMSGRDVREVRVVLSPYRICPLGAHIDHQGGTVSALTINKGILLGFVPSNDSQVVIQSGQFRGEVRFCVDETQLPKNAIKWNNPAQSNGSGSVEECSWGNYARGALYALQKGGNHIKWGIAGLICGAEGLDSSGLSSSAAVGVAYLLAFESSNNLTVDPEENIEYDRLIENEYLGLKNGILDQSAILLSSYGCLTCMNCKTKEHKLVRAPDMNSRCNIRMNKKFKILLAFSGLKQALTTNPGYNRRVAECQEAARILLQASGNEGLDPLLSNVESEVYEEHKCKLDPILAKRAEHYFSENKRVLNGLDSWASGNLEEFGKLISASGLSSIENYECGSEPLIQLYEILVKAPGVYGARFSGAGFRGCCIAFVDANRALDAASFVKKEYTMLQPKLASQTNEGNVVLICDAGDCARVI